MQIKIIDFNKPAGISVVVETAGATVAISSLYSGSSVGTDCERVVVIGFENGLGRLFTTFFFTMLRPIGPLVAIK